MSYRKSWIATSCLVGMSFACGNVDPVESDGTAPAGETANQISFAPRSETSDPLAPYLIERLELGEHRTDFVQVFVEEDGAVDASVMMLRSGPAGESPADALQRQFDVPLTMAEIYMGLKQVDAAALPRELAASQLKQAHYLGRTADFARPSRLASALVEKALDPNFFPVIPAHTWTEPRQQNQSLALFNPRYTCTGVALDQGFIFAGGGTLVNSCRTEWNRRGWIRGAAYNSSNSADKTEVVQVCFGPSTAGSWNCAGPEVFNQQFYKIADWSHSSLKRMSVIVSSPMQSGYAATFATGISTPN